MSSSLFTLRKELADEACGIRLYGRIRPAVEKLRCAARSNGVGVGEITAQVFHCLHRAGIGEQRTQFRRHVRDSASIIPQQVEQVRKARRGARTFILLLEEKSA